MRVSTSARAVFSWSAGSKGELAWLTNGIDETIHAGHPHGGTDGAKVWSGELPSFPQTLTLDLGETRSTSAVAAAKGDLWTVQLGAFDGSVDNGDADSLDTWVATAELTPHAGVTLGVSFLSDLAESSAELVQELDAIKADLLTRGSTMYNLLYQI